VLASRPAEAATSVTEICRKLEVTEGTFYHWKKRFGGLGVSELRELRHLKEANRTLDEPVAVSYPPRSRSYSSSEVTQFGHNRRAPADPWPGLSRCRA